MLFSSLDPMADVYTPADKVIADRNPRLINPRLVTMRKRPALLALVLPVVGLAVIVGGVGIRGKQANTLQDTNITTGGIKETPRNHWWFVYILPRQYHWACVRKYEPYKSNYNDIAQNANPKTLRDLRLPLHIP